MNEPTLMTTAEYHQHSHLGIDTIRRYCREGKFPYIHVEKTYIDWEEADRVLKEMAKRKMKNRPTNYSEAVAQMKQEM